GIRGADQLRATVHGVKQILAALERAGGQAGGGGEIAFASHILDGNADIASGFVGQNETIVQRIVARRDTGGGVRDAVEDVLDVVRAGVVIDGHAVDGERAVP